MSAFDTQLTTCRTRVDVLVSSPASATLARMRAVLKSDMLFSFSVSSSALFNLTVHRHKHIFCDYL